MADIDFICFVCCSSGQECVVYRQLVDKRREGCVKSSRKKKVLVIILSRVCSNWALTVSEILHLYEERQRRNRGTGRK